VVIMVVIVYSLTVQVVMFPTCTVQLNVQWNTRHTLMYMSVDPLPLVIASM